MFFSGFGTQDLDSKILSMEHGLWAVVDCAQITLFFSSFFFFLTSGLKSVPHKFVKTRFSESNSAVLCRENVGVRAYETKSDSWFEFRSMHQKINQTELISDQ